MRYTYNIYVRTHDEIIQSKEVIEHGVWGFLGVPMGVEETTDVFRSECKDGKGIRKGPWVVGAMLRHCSSSRQLD